MFFNAITVLGVLPVLYLILIVVMRSIGWLAQILLLFMMCSRPRATNCPGVFANQHYHKSIYIMYAIGDGIDHPHIALQWFLYLHAINHLNTHCHPSLPCYTVEWYRITLLTFPSTCKVICCVLYTCV